MGLRFESLLRPCVVLSSAERTQISYLKKNGSRSWSRRRTELLSGKNGVHIGRTQKHLQRKRKAGGKSLSDNKKIFYLQTTTKKIYTPIYLQQQQMILWTSCWHSSLEALQKQTTNAWPKKNQSYIQKALLEYSRIF